MNKVSVCILIRGDYASTVYSFERSGFAIVQKEVVFVVKDAPKEYIKVIDETEVELLVGIVDGCDKRLVEYFTPLADKLIMFDGGTNDAKAYNELFRHCNGKYICILNTKVFLQTHWLNELIYYNNNVLKQGVVGIANNFSNLDYLPLLSNDNETFTKVFIPKDNLVNQQGVLFFLKEYLFYVGAFDENQTLYWNAINQFQLRCLAMGLHNYYIPNQTCLIVDETERGDKTELINSINEMRKNKNYYLPL